MLFRFGVRSVSHKGSSPVGQKFLELGDERRVGAEAKDLPMSHHMAIACQHYVPETTNAQRTNEQRTVVAGVLFLTQTL